MEHMASALLGGSFPALVAAHFMALISPGPDFFLIVGRAVRTRLKGTAFICLGIALGNALYICLAIAGWAGIRDWPMLYRCLELGGSGYLIWMGFLLWKSGQQPFDLGVTTAEVLPPARQFFTGLGSALLNPKNAIFYLTLMTVIMGPEATFTHQAMAGIWMTLVVLFWDLGLAACISLPHVQRGLTNHIPLFERGAGVVLLVLGVGIGLRCAYLALLFFVN